MKILGSILNATRQFLTCPSSCFRTHSAPASADG
uniref:Uncharacterized protein n=1 Tax=Arundo donax TaxID=35708 RepID=A0A0A8YCZ9_ARUDO